jgi:hypothetical protein
MTTFNVTKSVNESFSIKMPNFVENLPPTGKLYTYCRFFDSMNITIGVPSYNVTDTTMMYLCSPILAITPTMVSTGPNEFSLTTTADDCLLKTDGVTFLTNSINLAWGTAGTQGGTYKSWVPFIITGLAQGTPIISATLTVIAEATSEEAPDPNNNFMRIYCENITDAVVPTTYDQLNMKTTTATSTLADNVLWVAGTTYTMDVKNCIQEIVNLAGWGSDTRTLALVFMGTSGDLHKHRSFASYDHPSYPAPTLLITT